MNQVVDFFWRLFESDDWPPRWSCGRWTDFHGWLYICSDLAIWMAYFAIPFLLVKFVTKKREVPLPSVFWLFGAFILFCGLTHFVDALMFWWPAYRLNGLIRFITAAISWITVIALIRVLPQAFALRTSAEYNAELNERKKAEKKLNEYAIELEQKNRDIEQLAYIASHDLQEPLRTVSNYIAAMKEDYGDQLDDGANHYLNSIGKATARMNVLVKALMNFSNLGAGKKLTHFNCRTLLDEVIADLENLIHTTGTKIEIGEMPILDGYETEMRQLFQNLIVNAIKFRRKDNSPMIRINAGRHDDKWEFSVKDNGIGILPEHAERIFYMFQRLHANNEYEGHGIGLANCKKIVELHKGTIRVESELGKGSDFIFTIANLTAQL